MKVTCPRCQNEVEYILGSDPDRITCPHCNTDLKLDYVGDLPNIQYFLVEREEVMGMATKVDREYKPGLIYIPGKLKVKVFFAWYDFWVGGYYDRKDKELYVCPFPCIVFKFYRVTKVEEE